jgi:hypothetical protein
MGAVDVNSMGEMMNLVLDPLTRVARREKTTILVVHHFNKSRPEGEARGGTRLNGSVALHAWAENSFYLTAGSHSFGLELESKYAPSNRWTFNTDPTQKTWSPQLQGDDSTPIRNLDFAGVERPQVKLSGHAKTVALTTKRMGPGPHRCTDIANRAGLTPAITYNTLRRLEQQGRALQDDEKLWTVNTRS